MLFFLNREWKKIADQKRKEYKEKYLEEYYKMKRYQIDLCLDPKQRWNRIILDHKENILKTLETIESNINSIFGNGILSNLISKFFSGLTSLGAVMYYKEIEGIAELLGISVGKVAMLQLAYEFNTSCTSILYKNGDEVLHYRTMDWNMLELKPLTIEVEFKRNGIPIFVATTWPGYVGILTGMRIGTYAVSINYRRVNEGMFRNLLNGLFSCWPISFLVRYILENYSTYEEAKNAFRNSYLMAPVYIILSGKTGGRIFTRDRTRNVRELKLEDYLVQTNIDHWRGFEKSNDWQDIEYSRRRKKFAYNYLTEIDQIELNDNGTIHNKLWKLLNTYPINKEDTIYLTGMCVAAGYYETRLPDKIRF